MNTYQQHPLSAAWPAMQADEYQALKDSIEVIGIQNPITLLDDMVIDGWHRYSAAVELGVACPVKPLGDVDPVDFVKSQNEARRNVTASQRAMAISAIYAWRPHGVNTGVNRVHPRAEKTNDELAALAGTTKRTIQQAKVVQAKASPEVKAAVKAGKMSVKAAAATVAPPKPPKEYGASGETVQDDAPDDAELQANALAAEADLKALQLLIDADDKLAAALAEVKRLNAEVAQLTVSRNGYMNEVATYKQIAAKVQRENDRLRKPK